MSRTVNVAAGVQPSGHAGPSVIRQPASPSTVPGAPASEAAPTSQVDQWMRSAIEFSTVGTLLLDEKGHVVYGNDVASEILGIDMPDLIGSSLRTHVHPEDRTIDPHELMALDRGEIRSITNEWRLADGVGRLRWVRTHLALVRADGSLASYVVQLEDVTERRRLEHKLQRSERIARATLDALDEGVLLVDTTGVVHEMNPAAVRLLGFDAQQLTARWQRHDWDTFDENGRLLPVDERPLQRAITLGQRITGERVMWRRASGELMHVRVTCIPADPGVLSTGGRAIVITFTDITEARRIERLLEATLETAPAGLALVDAAQGTIVQCNPAFARQVGRPIADLVGTVLFDLLQESEREPVRAWAAAMLGCSGAASSGRSEQVIRRPDGTEVTLHSTLALIDQLDEPVFIAATFDMTEYRAMENALARFGHLFERTNDLISVIDLDGVVRYATPSHERVLGLTQSGDERPNIFHYLHADDAEMCRGHVFSLLDGAESAGPFTVRLRDASGQYHLLESVATNLLDEPSVGGIVFTSRDVTDRELLMEQLAHRASHDLLTELPTRMLFESRLTESLARSDRSGARIGLCFIDLDDFKKINDTLGHAAGDQVLVEVAERLRAATREGDTPARIGGDEFVVLLDPVADLDEAELAARRIRDALVDPPIVSAEGAQFGASVGVAISRPGESPEGLQSRADRALYRAKERRNSAVESSPDPVARGGPGVCDQIPALGGAPIDVQ